MSILKTIGKILSIGHISPLSPLNSPKKNLQQVRVLTGRAAVGSTLLLPPIVATTIGTGAVYAAASHPKVTLGIISAAIASTQNPAIGRAVLKSPSEFTQASLDAGRLTANPTIEGVKNFLKEHPLYSSLIAGSAIYAAYKSEQAIAGLLSNEKGPKQPKEPKQPKITEIQNSPVGVQDPAVGSPSTMPLPMETQELGKSPSGKRRRKHLQPRREEIRQSVRVNIINTNSVHRINKYIKQGLYV